MDFAFPADHKIKRKDLQIPWLCQRAVEHEIDDDNNKIDAPETVPRKAGMRDWRNLRFEEKLRAARRQHG